MNNKWIWLPNVGVNEFLLNAECSKNILTQYELNLVNIYRETTDDLEFEYTSNKFGISVILLNNLICDRIEIWKNLYLNNIEIIGLSINLFKNMANINDLVIDKQGDFYKSEKLDAFFWIENNIITSVSF